MLTVFTPTKQDLSDFMTIHLIPNPIRTYHQNIVAVFNINLLSVRRTYNSTCFANEVTEASGDSECRNRSPSNEDPVAAGHFIGILLYFSITHFDPLFFLLLIRSV